ncbi:MAG: Putative membrane protein YdgH [Owenweeksia sp. TMED14]|nr:MAG: Putative membrane protein YdgH [Owenweeksia sp. TMED14]|tara:strand:+ start:679 stop:3030 length:2352 start_codon:yes stop_codon:yes gene_type:complete
MWERVGHFILKNRKGVLLFWILYVLFMGFSGRNVDISYHFAKMLPANDSVFTTYNRFQEEFAGSGSSIVLGAKDDSFFTPSVLNAWKDMAERLEKEKEVIGVLSLHNAVDMVLGDQEGERMKSVPIMSGEVDSPQKAFNIRDHYDALPIYHGLLSSRDNKTHLMAISITEKANYSEIIYDLFDRIHVETKRFERRTGIPIEVSGLPYLRLNNARSIKGEINLFMFLTALGTVLIMLILLRSMRAALIALVVVAVGVIGSFGIMGLLGFKITLFSALLPPLLIVIVVPNCIFFINKYHQEYARDKKVNEALLHTVKKIGGVAFLTNTTTALGFATFALTSSDALVHFGVAATINILVVFVLSLSIIPVIYSWLSEPKKRHYNHLNQKWITKWIEWLVRISESHRKKVYLGSLVVCIFGVVGMTLMETTGNLTTDINPNDPLVTQMRFFEEEMGGVIPLEIIINSRSENGIEKSKLLRRVDYFQSSLDTFSQLSRSLSLVDMLKFGRQTYYGGDPLFYALPNSQERTLIASSMPDLKTKDLGVLTKGFSDNKNQKLRISVQAKDLPRPEMINLVRNVQNLADSTFSKKDYDVEFTGASLIFLRSTKFLINNLVLSLLLAIAIISLIMAFLFKTPRMVVVAIIPNLLPLLMTAGLMGWFGIPVKPSTVLIFSISFGISIDDTLHYLARYRQELIGNGHNISLAAITAIRETGISMFYTSIVLFSGFFIFLASDFGGTQALGLLVSITLVFAMFSNLILLPSLLISLDKVMTGSEMENILIDLAEDE